MSRVCNSVMPIGALVFFAILLTACNSSSTSNSPPITDAGIDQNIPRDSSVTLDGSASNDPDGDALSYQWSFVSIPAGSRASLSDSISVNPSFIADVLGEYEIILNVSDGNLQGNSDEIRVVVDTITIYSNDFSSSVLTDFIVGEEGVAKVSVENGQLKIDPGDNYLNRGYVSIDLPSIHSDYRSRLSLNEGKVVFSFNVSNIDAQVCGACNNLFYAKIRSDPDPSKPDGFGYSTRGGGLVQDRMEFIREAHANSPFGPVYEVIADISNGLSTLPSIGAFKVTYDPATKMWELYFDQSVEVIDPTTLTTLIGTFSNEGFVDEQLPYFILGSEVGDSAYFDNIKISLEFTL